MAKDRRAQSVILAVNKIDISVNPGQNKASPRLPLSQALPHLWERNCNRGVRRCIPNRAAIFEISPVGNDLDRVIVSRWHPEFMVRSKRIIPHMVVKLIAKKREPISMGQAQAGRCSHPLQVIRVSPGGYEPVAQF